jgi:hypothetical protein
VLIPTHHSSLFLWVRVRESQAVLPETPHPTLIREQREATAEEYAMSGAGDTVVLSVRDLRTYFLPSVV